MTMASNMAGLRGLSKIIHCPSPTNNISKKLPYSFATTSSFCNTKAVEKPK